MHTLRLIHRWIGLVVALPIVLVALSGGMLVFRDPYYRVRWPVVAQEATAAEFSIQPHILTQIEARFGDSLRIIKFPRDGVNAFHVYLVDEVEALVDPRDASVFASWHWMEDPAAFLFELHANLLMGAQGELLNGYLALVLLFIALTGIVLWYPRRQAAFRLRHATPRGVSSAMMLKSHAASGVLLLPAVALFAATGVGLVFYEPVGRVAERVLNASAAEVPTASVAPSGSPRADWHSVLASARAALPESGPRMYYRGRGDNVVLTFRKSLPGEWHPNGRSYVLIDPYTAAVVQTIDARAQGAGTRVMHALYPLHAAKVGGAPFAIVGVLTALGLAWLAAGGSWVYVSRWSARPARTRQRDRADVTCVAPSLRSRAD